MVSIGDLNLLTEVFSINLEAIFMRIVFMYVFALKGTNDSQKVMQKHVLNQLVKGNGLRGFLPPKRSNVCQRDFNLVGLRIRLG